MTIYRPNADLANSGWSPSTGSDNYAVVDEASTDDADYISTSSAGSVVDIALPVTALADTNTVKYRAASPEADRGLIVELREKQAPVIITSKQPWRRQPQDAVRLSSEWAQKAAAAFVFNNTIKAPNCGIKQAVWSSTAGPYCSAAVGGVGITSTTYPQTYGNQRLIDGFSPANSPAWLLVSFTHAPFVNRGSSLNTVCGYTPFFTVNVTSGNILRIIFPSSISVDTITLVIGKRYSVFAHRTASGICYVYVDGVLVGQGSGSVAADSAVANYVIVSGDYNSTSVERVYSGVVHMFAIGGKETGIPSKVSENPWQIFEPQKRTIYSFPSRLIAAHTKSAANLGTSVAEQSLVLSAGEKAAITDPTQLFVRMKST